MSADSPSETDPVIASHRRYVEAVKAGDVAAIVDLYCEDTVFMPQNDPSLYGRDEVKEWHQEYFQHFHIVTLVDTDRAVMVLDGWVVERWGYAVAIDAIEGSRHIRDEGRFVILWRRDPDGVWRMCQAIQNSTQPIGSGTSRFLALMSDRKKG